MSLICHDSVSCTLKSRTYLLYDESPSVGLAAMGSSGWAPRLTRRERSFAQGKLNAKGSDQGPERRPVAGEAVRRQKELVGGTYTGQREIASPGIAARADRLVTLPLRMKKR